LTFRRAIGRPERQPGSTRDSHSLASGGRTILPKGTEHSGASLQRGAAPPHESEEPPGEAARKGDSDQYPGKEPRSCSVADGPFGLGRGVTATLEDRSLHALCRRHPDIPPQASCPDPAVPDHVRGSAIRRWIEQPSVGPTQLQGLSQYELPRTCVETSAYSCLDLIQELRRLLRTLTRDAAGSVVVLPPIIRRW
jgi:hypothetical protein